MSDPFNVFRCRAKKRKVELRITRPWGDGSVLVAYRQPWFQEGLPPVTFHGPVLRAVAWLEDILPAKPVGAPRGNRNAAR